MLTWDTVGERFWETGVDHGVLYPTVNNTLDGGVSTNNGYKDGVAWNGLTSVEQSPSGGEANAQYADNIKYLNLISAEEFGFTINAFTYPDEFMACDGSLAIVEGVTLGQQTRKQFGFSYRTKIGNDIDQDLGYKLHLVYNCYAQPSSRSYETVNDSPEAINLSWEITTTPVEVGTINNVQYKPTAHIEIDTNKVQAAMLKKLTDVLYGAEGAARLPLPGEIYTILTSE